MLVLQVMLLDEWLETARRGECLPEEELKKLCEYVKELLIEEANVQPVFSPVTVCGDIHGQFFDLLELFRTGGEIPYSKYIFMVCKLHLTPSNPLMHNILLSLSIFN